MEAKTSEKLPVPVFLIWGVSAPWVTQVWFVHAKKNRPGLTTANAGLVMRLDNHCDSVSVLTSEDKRSSMRLPATPVVVHARQIWSTWLLIPSSFLLGGTRVGPWMFRIALPQSLPCKYLPVNFPHLQTWMCFKNTGVGCYGKFYTDIKETNTNWKKRHNHLGAS